MSDARRDGAQPLKAKLDSFRVIRAHGLIVSTVAGLLTKVSAGERPSLLALRRAMQEFVRLPDSTRQLQLGVLGLEPHLGKLDVRLAAIGLTVALVGRRLGLGSGAARDLGAAALMSVLGRGLVRDQGFADVDACAVQGVFLAGLRATLPVSSTGLAAAQRIVATVEQASAGTRRGGHALSRLVAVVDRYDLLKQPPPHGRGLRADHAIAALEEAPDLDPEAVHALACTVGIYPVGSPVRLTTGHTGIVVDVPGDPQRLRTPPVLIMEDGAERHVEDLAATGAGIQAILDRTQLQLNLKHFLFA